MHGGTWQAVRKSTRFVTLTWHRRTIEVVGTRRLMSSKQAVSLELLHSTTSMVLFRYKSSTAKRVVSACDASREILNTHAKQLLHGLQGDAGLRHALQAAWASFAQCCHNTPRPSNWETCWVGSACAHWIWRHGARPDEGCQLDGRGRRRRRRRCHRREVVEAGRSRVGAALPRRHCTVQVIVACNAVSFPSFAGG